MRKDEVREGRGGRNVFCVVTLEYGAEERWPRGVHLLETPAGFALTLGKLPGFVSLGTGGMLLGLATLYAGSGSHQVYQHWRAGFGIDAGFCVAILAIVLLIGGVGAWIIRKTVRYGHVPTVFRL